MKNIKPRTRTCLTHEMHNAGCMRIATREIKPETKILTKSSIKYPTND
jgi:hypothetical protein